MLQALDIRNFVLVEQCHLELFDGMTVLTGETGAGKSILIDALALVLGARADQNFIRFGCDKAEISATFLLQNNATAQAWLAVRELEPADELLIRRVLTRDGRTRAFVNGTPVTLQELHSLTPCLVDIQGQHAHQQLLHRDHQRKLLDAAAQHPQLMIQLHHQYTQWRELTQQLASLVASEEHKLDKIEVLRYQVNELQLAALHEIDLETLELQHKRLCHQQEILTTADQALYFLSQAEPVNAIHATDQALELIQSLLSYEPNLIDAITCLSNAQIQLSEAEQEIKNLMPDEASDQSELAQLESQLQDLYALARKHQIPPRELSAKQTQLEQQLQTLESLDQVREQTEQALRKTVKDYLKLAKKLSERRSQTAQKLSKQINQELTALGLNQATFKIDIRYDEQRTLKPHGLDEIQFLIATNPGQPLQALNQIASGGELSRFSLAIQTVLASDNQVPTLIFDEVDSGIGGAVAEMVGQKMSRIGASHQVLCVTHLAQVAAQAKHHIQVSKTAAESTSTQLNYLAPKARVEEIARMLGGSELTKQTRNHAKEMLQRAQQSIDINYDTARTIHTG